MSGLELTRRDVKVRKPRICDWCGHGIVVGEPAVYRFGKYDGEPCSSYIHLECWAAVERETEDLSDGWEPGIALRGMTISESETERNHP